MERPLKVGITGGIGSGKSTVARIFENLGIPVYHADARAKLLMVENKELKAAIRQAFGEKAYTPEGLPDRAFLAGQVFHDKEKLATLNALVHPVVREDGERWHAAQSGVPYTLKEAALLYESGSYRDLDLVLVVTAPKALRIRRVMARDGVDEAAVRARMDNQWPEDEKVRRADIVIHNDGKQLLLPQVMEVHHLLCRKASVDTPAAQDGVSADDEILIDDWEAFRAQISRRRSLVNCTLRGIDFREQEVDWQSLAIGETTFLGCRLDPDEEVALFKAGAYIYTAPENLPYRPFRRQLYTWQELLEGHAPGDKESSCDLKIYQHFEATRNHTPVNEALWQRIHDHAIDHGLRRLLAFDRNGMSLRRGVGFMGGHSTLRTDRYFRRAAQTARLLTRAGYFVVSGGGPGIMEAANLGAYLSAYDEKDFTNALEILAGAPHYHHPDYYTRAFEVLERFPEGAESLAIPTWFYGHEPSNVFASHIAKYFSNSLREDTLLAIALYGIVFAPGSAGTTQEIFMDAAQNHYATFDYISPMVFLGRARYSEETGIFPLLQQLAKERAYGEMLFLTDEPAEILRFLEKHPPRPSPHE